ncbi:MAG TPA: acyl-CoA dehydrogenase family protein [Streptosporangiaceae bacterium]|nr:acyl-CoA dehydrogenase family protein [Streptosporangiaceae bacterium]
MSEPAGSLSADSVRADVKQWIADHWDPELSLREWRYRLADSGWACPTWPTQWCGRGLSGALGGVVAEEMRRAVVPETPEGVGMMLVAPILIEYGSDELNERYIRPTVKGEITWCQLFSEPGAGSDLAGLQSRAVRDGGSWRLSGQKVWSTGAATADFGLLLARTDWDVPKHQGITAFVLPMRQPGVTVRPLRQMNGHSSFNEVFFDDALVPADHVIGEPGGGWLVARATLAHERRLASFPPLPSDVSGRAWREAIAERTAIAESHKWYPQRAGRPDLVIAQAQALGRSRDRVVRQEIAKLIELSWSARWMAERAAAARAAGQRPGPEGSLGKLASSKIAKQAARVHSMIAGTAGLLAGPESLLGGTITEISVSVPAISIAGGTDEIQRSIIAERILGLPREPDVSVGIPFRDVRTG